MYTEAQSTPAPAEFPITSGSFGGKALEKGRARIDNGRLLVDGKRMFRTRPTLELPLWEVTDVRIKGASVVFQSAAAIGSAAKFVLVLKTRDEAARLAFLLPRTQTPEFAAEMARQQRLAAAYTALGADPYVTPIIAALCTLVYLVMAVGGVGWMSPDPAALIKWGGNFWLFTTSGQWWRLLTGAFMHGGFLHLAMNMQALLVTGLVVERLYGSRLFAIIYLFGALASSLASIWFNHSNVVVGASGAVFAVYGALGAVLLRQKKSLPREAASQLGASSGVFVLYNLVVGFTHAGISNSAHIGGLLAGFALGLVLSRPLDQPARSRLLLPKTLMGLMTATALIALMVVALPKSRIDLRSNTLLAREGNRAAEMENRNEAGYNEAVKSVQEGTLTHEALANAIESRFIPDLDRAYAGVLALAIPAGSSEHRRHTLMVEYYRIKREFFHQTANGLRGLKDKGFLEAMETLRLRDNLHEQLTAKDAELKAESEHQSAILKQELAAGNH